MVATAGGGHAGNDEASDFNVPFGPRPMMVEGDDDTRRGCCVRLTEFLPITRNPGPQTSVVVKLNVEILQ
uniref:Uncharacterized protein n=1 Tax=Anopheles minimus TaxID=112268 RepID=A0A182WNY2_9DIPT